MSKITCENIHSRTELYKLIDNFILKMQDSSNLLNSNEKYTITNLSNSIIINFETPKSGLLFLEFINKERVPKGNMFFDMKVRFSLLESCPYIKTMKFNKKQILQTESFNVNKNVNKEKSFSKMKLNHIDTDRKRNYENSSNPNKNTKSISKNQSSSINKENINRLTYNIKEENEFFTKKDLIKKKYLKESSPLKLSSPYLDTHDMDKIDFLKSKAKWINKKGFNNIPFNTKHYKDYIPNYVNISKGLSSNDVKFRSLEKSRWIIKKGFDIYKSPSKK